MNLDGAFIAAGKAVAQRCLRAWHAYARDRSRQRSCAVAATLARAARLERACLRAWSGDVALRRPRGLLAAKSHRRLALARTALRSWSLAARQKRLDDAREAERLERAVGHCERGVAAKALRAWAARAACAARARAVFQRVQGRAAETCKRAALLGWRAWSTEQKSLRCAEEVRAGVVLRTALLAWRSAARQQQDLRRRVEAAAAVHRRRTPLAEHIRERKPRKPP
eukprot:m51a1_g7309 hypothetical protein (226) ;mRNA; f:119156-120088